MVRVVGGGGEEQQQQGVCIGAADIAEFTRGDVCRRVILDEVIDSRINRVGCEEGEEACDVCEGIVRQVSKASTVSTAGMSVTASWQE